MRRLHVPVTTALIALTIACAGSRAPETSAAPAGFDPSGMYDFIASIGIEARTGTIEIERTATGYDGEAWLEGEGQPALIESATVDGNHVVLNALVNGRLPVVFELDFSGATFTGIAIAGNDTIEVDGTRRGS